MKIQKMTAVPETQGGAAYGRTLGFGVIMQNICLLIHHVS